MKPVKAKGQGNFLGPNNIRKFIQMEVRKGVSLQPKEKISIKWLRKAPEAKNMSREFLHGGPERSFNEAAKNP